MQAEDSVSEPDCLLVPIFEFVGQGLMRAPIARESRIP